MKAGRKETGKNARNAAFFGFPKEKENRTGAVTFRVLTAVAVLVLTLSGGQTTLWAKARTLSLENTDAAAHTAAAKETERETESAEGIKPQAETETEKEAEKEKEKETRDAEDGSGAQKAEPQPDSVSGNDPLEQSPAQSWNAGAGIAALLDHPKPAEEEAGRGDLKEELPGSLVMANVQNVLNVRQEPSADAPIVGYLYADCGGTILEKTEGWTKLSSGDLKGWASDEYLLFGEDARKAAQDTGRMVATTTTGSLRIRKAPSLDAGVYDLLEEGAEYEVVDAQQLAFSEGTEISDDWVAVDFEGRTGYVSAEFVKVDFVLDHGETREEVERREEEKRREQETANRKKEIETTMAMDASDATLLAALIQCEAGSDVYEGQVAVGAVVMNRVMSSAYPNTIRDVIFASGQFTPAGSGKLGRVIASGNIWDSCKRAAADAMAGVSPVGSATRFRRAGNREGIVVGHHVFW